MDDDDELCLCFHVTRRKVQQYIRAERPRRASQLSQCYGAGTGCGWCRPFLERLMESDSSSATPVSPEEYAAQRSLWRKSMKDIDEDSAEG